MAGPICHIPLTHHDNHFGPHPGHPTVVGFHQAQQRRDSHGKEQPSSAVARGRSLLSELLLKEEGSGHYEVASCCSMDPCSSDTEEDDASLGWGSFCRDMEVERLERLADSTLGSGESDTCSAKSQPVPIPSITHRWVLSTSQLHPLRSNQRCMHDLLPSTVRVDSLGVLAAAATRAPAFPGPQLTIRPLLLSCHCPAATSRMRCSVQRWRSSTRSASGTSSSWRRSA
jgi:hypothetical protein